MLLSCSHPQYRVVRGRGARPRIAVGGQAAPLVLETCNEFAEGDSPCMAGRPVRARSTLGLACALIKIIIVWDPSVSRKVLQAAGQVFVRTSWLQ